MVKGESKSKAAKDTENAEQPALVQNDKLEELKVVSDSDSSSDVDSDSKSDSDSNSSSDQEDIEGFASDEDANSHKVKKLAPKKQSKNKAETDSDFSGVVYVSRLPSGFHERELSKYFSQFGDLKQVRLARNKKTGNSRHYGFIEFANKEDAKIAQETMNNYLLMGHLLQVRILPKGSKIEKLFKHKKKGFMQSKVKKSAEELKESAKNKHDQRMQKLAQSGIEFKW